MLSSWCIIVTCVSLCLVPIIHARLLWPFSPYCISLFALSVIFLFCEYCHIIFCFVFIISFFFFFLLFRGNLSPSVFFQGFLMALLATLECLMKRTEASFFFGLSYYALLPRTRHYQNPIPIQNTTSSRHAPVLSIAFYCFFFSMFFFCFMRTIPKLQTNHNSTNTQRMNHLLPPKESNNCY